MVSIIASPDAALDMYETSLASALTPIVNYVSPTKVVLTYGNEFSDVLEGNGFSIADDGRLTGGVIETVTESQNGHITFELSGASLPVTSLLSWFASGDFGATFPALLSGSNQITGSALDDRIFSSDGKDVIVAGAGDDEIAPGGGMNKVDGGDGFDTVILAGKPSSYELLHVGSDDYLISAHGQTKVTGVEDIYFAGSDSDIATVDLSSHLSAFDGLRYLASYSDLRVALGDNAAAATSHFINYGFEEGRNPMAFDPYAYLAANADVRAAVGDDTAAACRHYIQYGAAEGRTVTFDALAYVASYGDLIAGYGSDKEAGEKHYVEYGASEGRAISFDWIAYLAANPDLISETGKSEDAATRHYIDHGFGEGLKTSGFDALEYIASYGDLIAAYGADTRAATQQFVLYGADEGRHITFDAAGYAQANPDVTAALGTDPDQLALHYILYGSHEGRHFAGH